MALWVVSLASLAIACLGLWAALWRGPPAYAARLRRLELELADMAQDQERLAAAINKWRGRVAQAASPQAEPDGEPDPVRNPDAWKRWINAGGIAKYKTRNKGMQ